MLSIVQILLYLFDILWFIVLVHVIMSWLLNFGVLNYHQPLVRQIWLALSGLLDPIYRRIRSVLPDLGGVDLAPLVLLVGISAVRIVIKNNAVYLV